MRTVKRTGRSTVWRQIQDKSCKKSKLCQKYLCGFLRIRKQPVASYRCSRSPVVGSRSPVVGSRSPVVGSPDLSYFLSQCFQVRICPYVRPSVSEPPQSLFILQLHMYISFWSFFIKNKRLKVTWGTIQKCRPPITVDQFLAYSIVRVCSSSASPSVSPARALL